MPLPTPELVTTALLAIIAGVGLLTALVSLLRTTKPAAVVQAAAILLIPITGTGTDLNRLARLLAANTLRPRRLVFIIESKEDPAYRRLHEVLPLAPQPAEIFIAGPATASSQKSHNLARALARYDDGSGIVVLADADIAPQPDWFADLTRPLASGTASIVSGYRWAVPTDASPASVMGAWIERAVASFPKPPWYELAWGGSLAFAPGVLRRIAAVEVLEAAVSDDMALAAAAGRHGIEIVYRSRVLVPTPMSHSLASLVSFGARQYQMLRLHEPSIWLNSLMITSASLLLKAWLWSQAFVSPLWLTGLAAFLGVTYVTYGLRLLRAWTLGCWTIGSPPAEAAMLLVPLAGPLVDLVHLTAILKGSRVKRIVWTHCVYELERGRVVRIERRPWEQS